MWSSDSESICFYGNFHNLKEYVVSLYKFTFVFLKDIEYQSAPSHICQGYGLFVLCFSPVPPEFPYLVIFLFLLSSLITPHLF